MKVYVLVSCSVDFTDGVIGIFTSMKNARLALQQAEDYYGKIDRNYKGHESQEGYTLKDTLSIITRETNTLVY